MFGPPNKATACGMFTLPHIIAIIVCIVLIGLAVYFTRRLSDKTVSIIVKSMAIFFVVLEACKIFFKFYHNNTQYLDFWFPLSYCSLFIYALLMCGFGKGFVKKLGTAFICGGCTVAGFVFIVVPVTSLMDHPIYHFLSIHSMLFHSCMVYLGIVFNTRKKMELTIGNYKYYGIFVGAAIVISLILNPIFSCNLMILSMPINMPVELVNIIYENVPFVYTLGVAIVYAIIPFMVKLIFFVVDKIKEKSSHEKKEV